MIMTIWFI